MKRRTDAQAGQLGLQALYGITALAQVARVTRQMLLRLLRKNEVELVRSGRAVFVPLSEIERKIPPLWQSLCLLGKVQSAEPREEMRESREERRGSLAPSQGSSTKRQRF